MDSLRRGFSSLRMLIDSHAQQPRTQAATEHAEHNNNLEHHGGGALTGATVSQLLLNVECRAVVATAAKVKIHVSTVDSYDVRKHCSTQIAKRSEDGAFGASMDCSVDCRLQNHGRMEVRVYREDDSREHCTRSCLAFTSFSIRDLLRSKEPHSSLKLRTMDGGNEVGEVRVSRLQVEEETEEHALENRSSVLCDALHGSVQDKEHSPMMRAALCSQVCKVYRFQTEDHRWLLVREQMSETPLSFSLPKQLLSSLIKEHTDSSVSYSREQSCRARELLASIAQLQPLIFGLAEELLSVSVEVHLGRLQEVLESLKEQTTMFIHALQDELVRSALLDINNRSASKDGGSHVHTNGLVCEVSHSDQEGGLSPRLQDGEEYSQEEWDRTWANVGKCLDCIIAMVERLQGRERLLREQSSPESQETAGDTKSQNAASPSSFSSSSVGSWQEQLLPLVVTLRDCVREAVSKARAAMTFVVLQGAVAATVAQGPTLIVQRRHAVFSQGLSAVVCGFMLKLFGGLEDPEFLQQLHSVGILVQFEGLLSTYGEEVGMLEDMEVGVADLGSMAFTITEAKSEQIDDLLPTLSGSWGSFVVEVPLPSETFRSLPQELQAGRLIRVEPVLFNIGINQHQSLAERFGDSSLQERVNQQSCERLKAYCNRLREKLPHMAGIQSLLDLLTSLDRSMEAKKRKNVEVLWITASLCRKVNGVRLTSCKSAKDRTAMSVTLEQCMILKEQHALSQQNFSSALDSMRRDGCRTENVQKNIGSRKFAFSSVQLLTFPKLYRPPDGSYG
uniref:Type II inositol 3,4-bisphosphate 4-phosphatase-like n=1 Tax=Cyprinodon variegatus TaxID=28743 RepID=A0A3Q2CFG6_CYPVA